jgi:NAD(P)-dependent dehydrogenase (short-subunit alcohol dehydrogenase family)
VLASGFQVAATARNTEDLAELKDKYGDLVLPLSLDVTSETQACEAMKATIRTFGKLDVLVNSAGYGNVAPIEDTTLEDFRAQIETNLFWGDYSHQSRAALLSGAGFRPHHPGHFHRRPHRTHWTRTVCSR